MVGIKDPSLNRGVWQATPLVSTMAVSRYAARLNMIRGLHAVSVDPVLPLAVVELHTIEALQHLVKLPYVDYVEPAGMKMTPQDIGCSDTPPSWSPNKVFPGDVLPSAYEYNHIYRAWLREATGRGVTIGVVDTGMGLQQDELMPDTFAAAGRRLAYQGCATNSCMVQLPVDMLARCNHGTRIAGIIGASRNGRNIVGVAYDANLIVEKAGNSVVADGLDEYTSYAHLMGIRSVRAQGARIIEMAFGAINESQALADEIRFEYYRTDMPPIIFVGAAGTDICQAGNEYVVFPARMPEVLAVSAVTPDGSVHPSACYGKEVRLAAVLVDFETTGLAKDSIVTLGGTSGSSAMVAGAAALVWSKYPNLTPQQVIDRLTSTAWQTGRGIKVIDAFQAVGGLAYGRIVGKDEVTFNETYTLTAVVNGDGPFNYQWSTGETTPTVTKIGPGTYSVSVVDRLDGVTLELSTVVRTADTATCLQSCARERDECIHDSHSGTERGQCIATYKSCIKGC
jgi:subtilisin family serine protease